MAASVWQMCGLRLRNTSGGTLLCLVTRPMPEATTPPPCQRTAARSVWYLLALPAARACCLLPAACACAVLVLVLVLWRCCCGCIACACLLRLAAGLAVLSWVLAASQMSLASLI